jgi:hypothetical protein
MVYFGMVYYCFTNINFFARLDGRPHQKRPSRKTPGGVQSTAERKTTQPSLISNSIRLRMFLSDHATTNDSSTGQKLGTVWYSTQRVVVSTYT